MQETGYQQWWELHARVARGEHLSEEERALYDASLRELDKGETIAAMEKARQSRNELRDLETQHRGFEQRRRELDAKIAALESALAPQARQLLGAEE